MIEKLPRNHFQSYLHIYLMLLILISTDKLYEKGLRLHFLMQCDNPREIAVPLLTTSISLYLEHLVLRF